MTRSVVVIGNFDGVHPGHRAVLERARRLEPGLPLVVVTFWPHPVGVLHPEAPPMLLTSLKGRIELLQQAGASRVEVIDFDKDFAAWSPARFVEEILVPLNPARVVVGENFRFGRAAAGTPQMMRDLAHGRFEVDALPLVRYGDEETCSTLIREALRQGDVRRAGEHLGRPFRFRGHVVTGDRRGHTLGFPTANLNVPPDRACPADGVYAGWAWRRDGRPMSRGGAGPTWLVNQALVAGGAMGLTPDDPSSRQERWPAAISVGTNPTFGGEQRRVESHILGRDDLELYGVPIVVEFVDRIRGQVVFPNADALIAQMKADVGACRTLLGLE